MKKFIAAIALSLASLAAFAMPSPAQIENALASRDIATAQVMTQEVLAAKPNSAKAHLFNGYILLKQGDKAGAQVELQNVRALDKNGEVQNSALFGRTVAELQTPVIVRTAPVARPVVVHHNGGMALGTKIAIVVLITIFVVLILLYFGQPREVVVETRTVYESPYRETVRERVVHEPVVSSRYDATPTRTVVQSPTVVVHDNGMAGVNGMMTGMMLGEMMHHHHGHGGYVGGYASDVVVSDDYGYSGGSAAYVEPAVSVDSYSDRSSFSSGSSSSWDTGSSYSSSSDSSSSWDSGSSSDSGGGGWD